MQLHLSTVLLVLGSTAVVHWQSLGANVMLDVIFALVHPQTS